MSDDFDLYYTKENGEADRKWIDRLWNTLMSVGGIIICMVSFWLVEGRHFISRVEAKEIVQTEIKSAPYMEDRKLIRSELDECKQLNQKIVKSIEELNETIKKLELTLVKFSGDISQVQEEQREHKKAIQELTTEIKSIKR